MNKLITIFIFFFSLHAQSQDRCESWGCISTISILTTKSDGVIYVGTPLDETLANCTPVSGAYFTLNPASGNANMVYSALLATYMSGKKINLRVKEGHPQCELDYVHFDAAY